MIIFAKFANTTSSVRFSIFVSCNFISTLRYDSMAMLTGGIRSGLGVGILPDIPTLLDGLRIVGEQPPIYQTDLWLLYHPSNRGNPRITAFDGFVRGALAA